MIGVGGAAAGAVEPGPAVRARGAGVGVAGAELLPQGGVGHAAPHVSQLVRLLSHELVAGVQVPPGGDGHVLRAGAAAGDPLIDAGAPGEVQHVVVEGDGAALLVPFQHFPGQQLVLVLDHLQVLRRQGRRVPRGADHRLHGELGEAQVRHMEEVLRKVRVPVGEGAPHIVPGPAPGLHQLLEFGDDAVIAAVSGVVHPEGVVDFFPPVQGEDHVVHLPVGKVDHVLVNQHPVGGEGEAEALVMGLLLGPGIGHQVLHHLPVHQGLAAEEVHLQIRPGPGMGNEKIQGLPAHLEAHEGPAAMTGIRSMVVSLAGEAVGAVEVAGVGHVEAEGLYYAAGALFKGSGDA